MARAGPYLEAWRRAHERVRREQPSSVTEVDVVQAELARSSVRERALERASSAWPLIDAIGCCSWRRGSRTNRRAVGQLLSESEHAMQRLRETSLDAGVGFDIEQVADYGIGRVCGLKCTIFRGSSLSHALMARDATSRNPDRSA
jgi:hypothetical protein